MAEKGGKGFSSLSNSKGKTLSSGKAGRKPVQFESESSDSDSDGSPTPNITPSGKSNGDWGKSGGGGGGKAATPKGGVGDKTGTGVSGGKTDALSIPKFEIEGELPKNAKCMMDAEANDALQKIQEHLVILSEDSTIKLPESFHKGLQYAKSAGGYTNPATARRVLEMLKKNNVSDSEICLIGNICAESAEEVFDLMPSLKEKKRKSGRAIEDVLSDLAKLKSA